jgi:hypothetical protein
MNDRPNRRKPEQRDHLTIQEVHQILESAGHPRNCALAHTASRTRGARS